MGNGVSFIEVYDKLILRRPKGVILVLLALFAFFGYWIKDFRLDASGDSLVLEHDEDLRYYRGISERYESGDFAVVTYAPPGDLFSPESIDRLKALRGELRALDRVSSAVTMLDVPLLRNPPGSLKDLKDNLKTLENPKADIELAREEFRTSPLYKDLLVSEDLQSSAIQINFKAEDRDDGLFVHRARLRKKDFDGFLTPSERRELESVEEEYRAYKDRRRDERHRDILAIRAVIARYNGRSELFLGGIPMIVDDIITFIRKDLKGFGLGMMAFLVLTLGVIFRGKRWVVLPILCCASSVVVMMGLLGLSTWDVTVVSSNFISLQLIFTMSLAIHIVVQYRELLRSRPEDDNRRLIGGAVGRTFVPCLYASLTTIAGFASLVVCDILPVVNFGYMMAMGLTVSMIVTFLLLPAGLALLERPALAREKDFGTPLTSFFAGLTERRGGAIFAVSLAAAAATALGASRLEVENSFIDYFKESTEIYRGMKFIDRNLGGTTPLDVIIDFGAEGDEPPSAPLPESAAGADEDFDDFTEFEGPAPKDPAKYWFTTSKLELIERVHDYLDGLEATGKVMSLATLWKTARGMNEGKPLDDFSAALLFNSMTGDFKAILIDPFVSVSENQVRLNTRIKDSMRSLRRDALIRKIDADLGGRLGLKKGEYRVTGIMVLYNNMLQSLFDSQIKTIGFTVAALMVMFLVLFRSVKIALIAIFPNLLSSMSVLGVMGGFGIPLDVMTITIVAISVGIAVDDTIHYLHRFRREFETDRNYLETMKRCHGSIGNAMFYTSLTITIGFSILGFSNFIPTVLFGLLTALAMVMALLGALTLLPRLIIDFKAFGPEGAAS